MNANVVSLPASTTFTCDLALKSALDLELQDVIVLGYDKDGDFTLRSSRMSRQDALWLIELAKNWAMGK